VNQTAAMFRLRADAWRKVRAPQDMMPGNSREKSAGFRAFRQTAQQKVNRLAISGLPEIAR